MRDLHLRALLSVEKRDSQYVGTRKLLSGTLKYRMCSVCIECVLLLHPQIVEWCMSIEHVLYVQNVFSYCTCAASSAVCICVCAHACMCLSVCMISVEKRDLQHVGSRGLLSERMLYVYALYVVLACVCMQSCKRTHSIHIEH